MPTTRLALTALLAGLAAETNAECAAGKFIFPIYTGKAKNNIPGWGVMTWGNAEIDVKTHGDEGEGKDAEVGCEGGHASLRMGPDDWTGGGWIGEGGFRGADAASWVPMDKAKYFCLDYKLRFGSASDKWLIELGDDEGNKEQFHDIVPVKDFSRQVMQLPMSDLKPNPCCEQGTGKALNGRLTLSQIISAGATANTNTYSIYNMWLSESPCDVADACASKGNLCHPLPTGCHLNVMAPLNEECRPDCGDSCEGKAIEYGKRCLGREKCVKELDRMQASDAMFECANEVSALIGEPADLVEKRVTAMEAGCRPVPPTPAPTAAPEVAEDGPATMPGGAVAGAVAAGAVALLAMPVALV